MKRRLFVAELLVVLVGAWLRLRLRGAVSHGYDLAPHLGYIRFLVEHGELPPLGFSHLAYHPPLYYQLAAAAMRRGATIADLQHASITVGVLKLALVWLGLRLHLPTQALARLLALALAATLPAAVYLDAMVGNEVTLTLFATIALLLAPCLFRPVASRARAAVLVAAVGASCGLALLSKLSALTLLAALAAAGLAALLAGRDPLRARAVAAGRVAAALVIALLLALPAHARHYRSSGKLFPTAWDTAAPEKARGEQMQRVPYLHRRPLSFLVGVGESRMVALPFAYVDALPRAYFFPLLTATAFVDYYNYGYAGWPRFGEARVIVNGRPLATSVLPFARASFAAGAWIALTVAVAVIALLASLWRRRDFGRAAPLLASVAAVLGQLHFAVTYPTEIEGVVKAHYLQFAAAPLCAAWGIAVAWACRRGRVWRAFAVAHALALAAVAAYSIRTGG